MRDGMSNKGGRGKVARGIVFVFVAGVLSLGQAYADTDSRYAWTTAGSAGQTANSTNGAVSRGGAILLPYSAPAESVAAYYNVTATDALVGSIGTEQAWELSISFRDNGANSRVRVFLVERPLNLGPTKPVMSFDSDDHENGSRIGFRMAKELTSEHEFDFQNNAYFLKVVLTKYAEGVGPAFGGASLRPVFR